MRPARLAGTGPRAAAALAYLDDREFRKRVCRVFDGDGWTRHDRVLLDLLRHSIVERTGLWRYVEAVGGGSAEDTKGVMLAYRLSGLGRSMHSGTRLSRLEVLRWLAVVVGSPDFDVEERVMALLVTSPRDPGVRGWLHSRRRRTGFERWRQTAGDLAPVAD
jgi:hypothetical protein